MIQTKEMQKKSVFNMNTEKMLIKRNYKKFECLSSASINNSLTIYDQNQEPNPTGNISMTLNSKKWLMTLTLHILFNNKKSLNGTHVKNGIRNKKLEVNS